MNRVMETENLLLRPAGPELSDALLAYYRRNREFLEQFEPKRDSAFFTREAQNTQLLQEAEEAEKGTAFHFYLSEKNGPETILGCVGLNNIVRGCFLSCFLGYKLDFAHVNRGYMTQAVRAAAEFAFEDQGLHRVEANVMPRNGASLRVLEKCGFRKEGISEKYLKINGVWEDHVHMVLLNDNV